MARTTAELSDLLADLETALAVALDLSAACVFTTLKSDEEILLAPPDTFFVTIHPDDFVLDQGMAAGAGRNAVATDGTVKVCLWSNLNVDVAGQSGSWLTHSSLGMVAQLKVLINALQVYDPVDGLGQPFLEEPMRCKRWKNHPPRQSGKGPAIWGRLESFWETKFLQKLTGSAVLSGAGWSGAWL